MECQPVFVSYPTNVGIYLSENLFFLSVSSLVMGLKEALTAAAAGAAAVAAAAAAAAAVASPPAQSKLKQLMAKLQLSVTYHYRVCTSGYLLEVSTVKIKSLWVSRHLISWQPLFCWSPPDCLSKLPVAMSHSCCLPANSFSDLINSFCDCIYYGENRHSHSSHVLLSKLLSGAENRKKNSFPGFKLTRKICIVGVTEKAHWPLPTRWLTSSWDCLERIHLNDLVLEYSGLLHWMDQILILKRAITRVVQVSVQLLSQCNWRKKSFRGTVHHVMLQLEHMFQTVGE